MKFLIFIFFFIFNKSLQTLTFEWNPVITSIDKRDTSKITSWTNTLINTSNQSILPKASVIISLTDTNLLHGDVSYPITFNLNYNKQASNLSKSSTSKASNTNVSILIIFVIFIIIYVVFMILSIMSPTYYRHGGYGYYGGYYPYYHHHHH